MADSTTPSGSALPSSPTFHFFSKLPIELQLQVLGQSIDRTPRIFEIGRDFIPDGTHPKNTKLKIYLPSCPVRIPFAAAINRELRHEMAKTYDRVEFSNGVVWVNLKTDTIFISCLTDFRFLMNFGVLAEYNQWMYRIEHLAISVDKFFELQLYASHKHSELIPMWTFPNNRRFARWGFCADECGGHFLRSLCPTSRLDPRELVFDNLVSADVMEGQITTSLPSLLAWVPNVRNLRIVHQSRNFRVANTFILPGPLGFCSHSNASAYSDATEQYAAELLSQWQDIEPQIGQLQLEFVGLTRDRIAEKWSS